MYLADQLKAETQTLHSKLEGTKPFVYLTHTDVNLGRIYDSLSILLLGHKLVYLVTKDHPPLNHWQPFQETTIKLLTQDIREHVLDGLPKEVPTVEPGISEAFVRGQIYVMEGSKLGASVIAKHLERTLPATSHMPSYFREPQSMGNWRALVRETNTYGQAYPSLREQVVRGANWQFNVLLELCTEYELKNL